MDCYFHRVFLRLFSKPALPPRDRNILNTLNKYVQGKIKNFPSTPWKDARMIVIPMSMTVINVHWYLAVVDIDKQHILILDSDHSIDQDKSDLNARMGPLSEGISLTLQTFGITKEKVAFKWNRDPRFPQQQLKYFSFIY